MALIDMAVSIVCKERKKSLNIRLGSAGAVFLNLNLMESTEK
jgi:hypothetical protein